jgi:hypothetical protein
LVRGSLILVGIKKALTAEQPLCVSVSRTWFRYIVDEEPLKRAASYLGDFILSNSASNCFRHFAYLALIKLRQITACEKIDYLLSLVFGF